MPLVRLVYFSEPSSEFRPDDVKKILATARERNAGCGVTGALLFDHKWFLQVLEGGADQVNQLFFRIAADPRHQNVRLIDFRNITERAFTRWSMNYCGNTEHIRAAALPFMSSTTFHPPDLTAETALTLIKTVSERYADKTVTRPVDRPEQKPAKREAAA